MSNVDKRFQREWEKKKRDELRKLERSGLPVLNSGIKRKNDSIRYVQPANPVCAEIEDPPPGHDYPTHIKIGGVIFMLVPSNVFDMAVNEAFNRGFRNAIEVYKEQISSPVISEQISYVEMVKRGDFNVKE